MNHIKRFFWLFLLALSGVWWWTDTTVWSALPDFFAWRALLVQYSGVLGMGVMSVAMVLAVRPVWFESTLGGLDKMYRLHKWLGISGLVLAICHWLLTQSAKWAVGSGWLERPVRGPRTELAEGSVQQWLSTQRDLAEGVGEWAFYAAVVLMTLALVKRIPYRYFFKTHHFMAVAYLVLVFHTVVLLNFGNWTGWLGPVMAVLLLAGSVAAVLVLFGHVAARRQLVGEVVSVRQHALLKVLEVDIQFQGRWVGHEAGQFAFVTLHADEGAHPFTISSDWRNDGRLSFIIKALGDYTRTLASRTHVGDVVKVEGPYGRFNFQGAQPRQIWVGAGIGITPFVARMKALAKSSDGKHIDLFHTTAVLDPHAMELLQQDANDAQVSLHVLWDERDGRLTAARMAAQVPKWRDADVWFCGPSVFGQSLKKDLMSMGMSAGRFHQELFEMR